MSRLSDRFAAARERRAANGESAASFPRAVERVTTFELSHGRTVVVREDVPMSPFERRRREGTVPTSATLTATGEEGGAL